MFKTFECRVFYLLSAGALLRERAVEEGCNDLHDSVDDVVFELSVRVFPVKRGIRNDGHVNQEALFKQAPDLVRRVYLLHLNFRVDVAVVEEVYVSFFDLGNVESIRKLQFLAF